MSQQHRSKHNRITGYITGLLLLLLCFNLPAQDAKNLFTNYSDRIYQIRIIEISSGKQATIGSGFQISADGLIISNFHVVADFVHHPDRYQIEYASHDGQQGLLALYHIDVVNDLSLLKLEGAKSAHIKLADALPLHGEPIYSLGNPHDLGLTVVPGTYNGITTYSIYEHIHVSGAINSGMSGGPTLNQAGEVIGVNVLSSGNQVGFLVPLHRLQAFVKKAESGPLDIQQINQAIRQQLYENQQTVITALLENDWQSTQFGDANIPSKIAHHVRCWGYPDDNPEIRYRHATSYCREDESIYLSSHFNTGIMLFRFDWFETEELNSFQFYHLLQSRISSASADNTAHKEDVTDYQCHNDFIHDRNEPQTGIVTKASYCAREYKKYPGLYDVLYIGLTAHENNKALLSYFSLSGVSQEMAQQFAQKFITSISWN